MCKAHEILYDAKDISVILIEPSLAQTDEAFEENEFYQTGVSGEQQRHHRGWRIAGFFLSI